MKKKKVDEDVVWKRKNREKIVVEANEKGGKKRLGHNIRKEMLGLQG